MTYPNAEHALETANLTEMFDYIVKNLQDKQKEPLSKNTIETYLMFFMAGVMTDNSLLMRAFYIQTTSDVSV